MPCPRTGLGGPSCSSCRHPGVFPTRALGRGARWLTRVHEVLSPQVHRWEGVGGGLLAPSCSGLLMGRGTGRLATTAVTWARLKDSHRAAAPQAMPHLPRNPLTSLQGSEGTAARGGGQFLGQGQAQWAEPWPRRPLSCSWRGKRLPGLGRHLARPLLVSMANIQCCPGQWLGSTISKAHGEELGSLPGPGGEVVPQPP